MKAELATPNPLKIWHEINPELLSAILLAGMQLMVSEALVSFGSFALVDSISRKKRGESVTNLELFLGLTMFLVTVGVPAASALAFILHESSNEQLRGWAGMAGILMGLRGAARRIAKKK